MPYNNAADSFLIAIPRLHSMQRGKNSVRLTVLQQSLWLRLLQQL